MTQRILYFVSGLGIGIATALLYAPKPGKRTRAAIAGTAACGQDYVKRQAADARDAIANAIHRGKEAARTTTEGMGEALQHGKAVLRG